MDRLGSEERAALLELLGEYSVGAITVARKTGIHWADEKTLPWQSLIAGGETSHRMLIEFGDLYSRLETACQNNGISVPDALRLSDTAQELARQGELLERLEAINIPTGSLRSAKEAMESELDQLTEVSGRRSLLDRIKIDLAPSDLKKAREHRNKVLEHQWLLATAEGESLTAIRDDLRSGQEALKQAYSLLSDNQTLPSARTVKQTRRVISEAGLLKRIFKPYKVAEALACEWFGYAPKEVTHETLIDDLGELEGAAARWEATRVAEHLETPVSGTAKTVVEGQSDFDAYIQLLSSYGVTGSKIHLLLVTPVLEDVASSLEQLDRVPGDWAAYEGRKSALSETLQWIQANEPVLQAAERTCREENLLKASQITQMSEGCRAAQEHKSRLESLVSELNTGDIATTWASLSALTELMQVALNNADSLNERILLTPYSAEAQSFSAIEEEASIVASLAARLASGKGEIVPAENFSTMLGYLERHLQDLDGFNKLVQRRHIFTTAENYGLGSLLRALEQSDQLEDTSVLAPAALSYFLRTRAEAKYGDQMLEYSGPSLKSARQKLQEADRALISLGPESITAAALGQADPPEGVGHGRKSDYTEMALLRHELQKKRRIPPRKLLKRASGALASLFPCWMMVPSAVAQHLPREELFDLVIIDEASQMTPETSISALMRASQALICGDTNQLPPTNFFRGLSGEEEDDENVTTDEESILELANTQFHPKHRLRWHYRSRHEELISFSNHYVYDNDLVIFPSPGGASDQMGVSLVQINGTFSRGINPAEAQVMADHIVEFMLNNPHRSLGVVVMNQSQMEQLDGLMLRKAEQDPAVAKYIDSWADKDAGLEKFFVKNLENVQGDERDVIFIGTVYGRDSQGRFYQRFGPLNGASGKRRLNVLFSRAKEQIVTFSSIPMDQFNPSDNNEGARLLKLWLQFSHSKRLGENTARDERRGIPDSPFEEHVIASVESLGFEAVPQVGVSNYFIDIGVKHPNYPFGYLCGVECDGAAYHSSKVARDRDRLREEVLQRLGWELYRIWSTDWFRDPHGERRKLGDYLETMLAIKIASMPEIVEPEISEVEEVPMENSGLIQADDKEINVPAAVNEGDTEPEPIPTAITTANDRKGPITPGSKVRIRYLNGPRAGVEARFWLTDLSEEHIAEVPGYTTVRQTAPICQSMFGAYEGDLVSYDLQNNEVGVEILEVEL